jgi:hypothetical protein
VIGGGSVEKWKIAREGVHGWGGEERVKAETEKGELDVCMVVVAGRQGLDGMGGGKGHVCQGLHLAYGLRNWQSVET